MLQGLLKIELIQKDPRLDYFESRSVQVQILFACAHGEGFSHLSDRASS